METLVAIDPSLTGMAVCVWRRGWDAPSVLLRHESKGVGRTVRERMRRYESHLLHVSRALTECMPDMVLVEGYSFGSRGAAVIDLGEFGALLRAEILRRICDRPLYEVPPSCLKKFVTGKGNANKEQMAAHVSKRWDQIFDTNDETDAYALAQLGRCLAGWKEPETAFMRDVVAQVRGEKPVKAKRKKSA